MEAVVAIQKMTVVEFRALEFDNNDQSWYEPINGELVQKHGPAFRSPNPHHREISFELSQALGTHVKQNKLGKVYYAPIDVFLDGYNSLQPDLLFIPADPTGDGYAGWHRGHSVISC